MQTICTTNKLAFPRKGKKEFDYSKHDFEETNLTKNNFMNYVHLGHNQFNYN